MSRHFSNLIPASLVAVGLLVFAQGAQAGDAAVFAPIKQMMDGFNKGDIKSAKAVHVASPVIVDEFGPPYVWTGPQAFDTWVAGLTKSEAAEGKTDGVVNFGTPVRESVVGTTAYVVTPCTYTFKQKGKTLRETGTTTFILTRFKSGWKIRSWTWASPEGVPLG